MGVHIKRQCAAKRFISLIGKYSVQREMRLVEKVADIWHWSQTATIAVYLPVLILASSFLHIFPFPLKTAKLIGDFVNSGREVGPSSFT
jgi:hypothetical protein